MNKSSSHAVHVLTNNQPIENQIFATSPERPTLMKGIADSSSPFSSYMIHVIYDHTKSLQEIIINWYYFDGFEPKSKVGYLLRTDLKHPFIFHWFLIKSLSKPLNRSYISLSFYCIFLKDCFWFDFALNILSPILFSSRSLNPGCSLVWLELLLLLQQPLSRLCALGRMSRWLKRCGDYFRRRPLRILTAGVTTGLAT